VSRTAPADDLAAASDRYVRGTTLAYSPPPIVAMARRRRIGYP
jgi:hypothetical protein